LEASGLPLKGKVTADQPFANIVQLASGNLTSMALDETGEIWSWGGNNNNVLGQNPSPSNGTITPAKVSNAAGTGVLNHIVQVGVGDWNAAALSDDGYVYAWGWGYTVGQGANANGKFPNRVTLPDGSALTDVVQIAVGRNFALALKRDGSVYGWGDNQEKQTGTGQSGDYLFYAYPVIKANSSPLGNIVSISAGYNHGLALTAEGKVYAWGKNDDAQLGNTPQYQSALARYVMSADGTDDLSNIKAIFAGDVVSHALSNDGKIWAWGIGAREQLGQGETNHQLNYRQLPGTVMDVTGISPITNAVAIGSAFHSAFALLSDGTIAAWGQNHGAVLGQGITDLNVLYSTRTPKLVKSVDGLSSFAVGNLGAYPNLTRRGRL
jgi:alpha-tubulin suppressor-like RCC1 family protein